LPGAGRAEQDHVLARVQEVELPEVLDDGLLHAALEREVELLERLARREPRGLDAALTAVAVAGGHLRGEQRFGEALIAPLFLAGSLGEHGQRPGGRRRLQRPEEVRELGGGPAHAGITAS
jgi:hypothetical protein